MGSAGRGQAVGILGPGGSWMGRICFAGVLCLQKKGHRCRQFGETLWGMGWAQRYKLPFPGD